MKDKIIASAFSLEHLENLINDYWFSISYKIDRESLFCNKYKILNYNNSIVSNYYVLRKKLKNENRYYFMKKESDKE